jgi:hypothetical protein
MWAVAHLGFNFTGLLKISLEKKAGIIAGINKSAVHLKQISVTSPPNLLF